jgi:hypothetical protein
MNWGKDSLRFEGVFSDVWMERARFVAAVYCEGRYIGNLDVFLKPNDTFVGYVTGRCSGTVSLERMGLAANDAMYPVLPSQTPGMLWSDLSEAEIRGIQYYLNQSGYDAGPEDGKAGPKTRAAAARFAENEGRRVTRPNAVDDLLYGWANDI